jgi:hypothetical protein
LARTNGSPIWRPGSGAGNVTGKVARSSRLNGVRTPTNEPWGDFGISMSETTDWGMMGAIIGAATLVGTSITFGLVAYDVFRPERRKRKLRTPGTSHFIIPSVDHHECSYASQNELEHRVREITIPPHSESIIDFIIEPSIDFNTSQIIFACEEISQRPNLELRP